MKALNHVIMIGVAAFISFFAGLAGIGAVWGKDGVGFAGAALWLFIGPAAVIGIAGAYIVYAKMGPARNPMARAGVFVATTSFISLIVCTGGALVVNVILHSGTPKFVYIPAQNYSASIDITVPTDVAAGDTVSVRASLAGGPWIQVRTKDLGKYGDMAVYDQTTPPPAVDDDAAHSLDWESDPPRGIDLVGGGDPDTHGRLARFEKPGTYKVWATSLAPKKTTSNVVTVTVRPKGKNSP